MTSDSVPEHDDVRNLAHGEFQSPVDGDSYSEKVSIS